MIITFSALFAHLLMFLHERAYIEIYKFITIAFLIISIFTFQYPTQVILVTAFAVLANMVDILGINVYPILIEETTKPALINDFINKFNISEVAGKIISSMGIILLSQFNKLDWLSYIIWVAFAAHIVLFYIILVTQKPLVPFDDKKFGLKNAATMVHDSLQFIKLNSLVRISLYLMVWAQVVKFLIDYSFFQSIDLSFPKKEQIASFMSSTSLVLNVASFLAMNSFTHYFIQKPSLSLALSILPVTVMILSTGGLFAPNYFVITALYCLFYVLFRTIHKPIARSCLIPVPNNLRRSVALVLSFIIGLSNLTISGVTTSLTVYLDITLSLMIVIVAASLIFFLINQLDAYYIKNLWTSLHEKASPNLAWSDSLIAINDTQTEQSKYLPKNYSYIHPHLLKLNDPHLPNDFSEQLKSVLYSLRTSEWLIPNLEYIYTHAHQAEVLKETSFIHINFILDPINPIREQLLEIVYNFKPAVKNQFFVHLKKQIGLDFTKTEHYLFQIQPVENYMNQLKISESHLILKKQLLKLLKSILNHQKFYPYLGKIKVILNYDFYLTQDLIELLSNDKLKHLHQYIYDCVSADSDFNLLPLIENLEYLNYSESGELRFIISSLAKHKESDIQLYVQDKLNFLKGVHFNFYKPATYGEMQKYYQLFLHLIYLNEIIMKPKQVAKLTSQSVSEIVDPTSPDREAMVELHRRFLNKSKSNTQWQRLFA